MRAIEIFYFMSAVAFIIYHSSIYCCEYKASMAREKLHFYYILANTTMNGR